MNQLISRLGLLCAILLTLFACDDPSRLGLNLQPEEQLLRTLYSDTSAITTKVIMLDTVHMAGASELMAGSIRDANFGTTRAEGYARLLLNTKASLPGISGTLPIFDSVVLNLKIRNAYGDSTVRQTVNVHDLSTIPDTTRLYTADERIPVTTLLGSASYPERASGQVLRIPLQNSLGRELLNQLSAKNLKTQAILDSYLKGIRVSTTGPEAASVITFEAVRNVQSNLTLHYHYDLGGKDSLITTTVAYFVESSLDLNRKSRVFNHVSTNLSGSALAGLSPSNPVNTQQANNLGYVQGGAGIATLIDFPHLRRINKVKDSIMVNSAVLSIHPAPGTFANLNQSPPAIMPIALATADGLRMRDASGAFMTLTGEGLSTGQGYDASANINYNPSGRTFLDLDVTSYIQKIMNNQATVQNDYLLVHFPSTNSVTKVIFGDAKAPGSYRMRLKLYYTILKK